MLSVADARAAILAALAPRPATALPLAEALGLCLSESAAATVDSPPFDKAMMDGYAV
ncbi:molybdopterin molybdenumtransferase MoeA, partial [Alienimonas sp. DA493]